MTILAAISSDLAQAATSTSAAIKLSMTKFDPTKINDSDTSLVYEETTNFHPCLCNHTALTCDAYCCCDEDCNENTRTLWSDEKKCADVSYDTNANGLSLSDCITRKEVYEYNKKRGLTNYIDPFAQLFCVRFNYSPRMDFYWADTELTATDIEDLI